jgi:hypothetical protein
MVTPSESKIAKIAAQMSLLYEERPNSPGDRPRSVPLLLFPLLGPEKMETGKNCERGTTNAKYRGMRKQRQLKPKFYVVRIRDIGAKKGTRSIPTPSARR